MIEASDSRFPQQNSALQFPDLNFMSASVEPVHQECFPTLVNPGTQLFYSTPIFPGFKVPDELNLDPQRVNGAQGFHLLPSAHSQAPLIPRSLDGEDSLPAFRLGGNPIPNAATGLNPQMTCGAQRFNAFPSVHFETLLPTPNPDGKQSQPASTHGLRGQVLSNKAPGLFGNRYLIFDQSGGHTRMIPTPLIPRKDQSTAVMKCGYGSDSNKHHQEAKFSGFDIYKSTVHQQYDENHTSGKQSEMHEDTEEINALLYSDDEEDDDEDDEVMSTGHSPNLLKRTYEKLKPAEEVDSSGGPNKRLKLLQGRCKDALLSEDSSNANLDFLHGYSSNIESNHITEDTQEESVSADKASRKVKIREMLRKLESIVPDAEGKDPLLVIDEAIDYLKSLKHMAKNLEVHYD